MTLERLEGVRTDLYIFAREMPPLRQSGPDDAKQKLVPAALAPTQKIRIARAMDDDEEHIPAKDERKSKSKPLQKQNQKGWYKERN